MRPNSFPPSLFPRVEVYLLKDDDGDTVTRDL